ncbi:MAG: hypothetical protein JWM11_7068 [Planctomycetaceae bacterium]|nr:hypothetical protein [Planctomycetaceae bacterium]
MPLSFEQVYHRLRKWAETHSIRVADSSLAAGKAGEFDGISITMNSAYDAEERAYYLAHALGSTIGWSLDQTAIQEMFAELRDAKLEKSADRLENAIMGYRAFENDSSAYAVSILNELGVPQLIGSFTNFMRADLEALTEYHRCGQAPVWRDFFSRWNAEVTRGLKKVAPFQAKPVPHFSPLRITLQEILQQQPES